MSTPAQQIAVPSTLPSPSNLPIGASMVFPDSGTSIQLADGSVWLRSGVYRPASQYPIAAKLPHLQVLGGVTGGTPSNSQTIATAATDGNLTIVLGPSSLSTLTVSTDGGMSFTTVNHNLTPGTCSDVTWVPWLSMFVAVSSSATNIFVATSPNGITWTQVATIGVVNSNASAALLGISTNQLCIVVSTSAASTGYIATSSNGTSWAVQITPSINLTGPMRPIFGAGTWLIGSTANISQFLTSTNGVAWVLRSGPTTAYSYTSLIYCCGQFFLYNSVAYTSLDGINWTARGAINANNSGIALAGGYPYSDGQRIVIGASVPGQTGNLLLTSVDAVNWQQQGLTSPGPYYLGVKCSTGFVLLGTGTAPAFILNSWPTASYVGTVGSMTLSGGGNYNGVTYFRVK